ncbi:LCP family protein [Candidatus Woesebacteria bacterium]|nr:LCP family protein [Candidatus Woesebacteria bacterium]
MEEKEPVEIKDKSFTRNKVLFSKIKRRILKHLWVVRVLVVIGIVVVLAGGVVGFGFFFKDSVVGKYMSLAGNFIFAPSEKIESFSGRTNILLLGKGGAGHEAPDLTDTIILVSVDHETPDIFLLSTPRDIWMPAIRAKINSAYYWGNQKENTSGYDNGVGSGGMVLAKSSVEEVVGVPVHYAAVLDFGGFRQIIDVVGGVEIDVKRGFVDEKYPIEGRENDECLPAQTDDGDTDLSCRYETIEFSKGLQVMDGQTALKFVRSRNAEGEEGTDFAREERQQLVINALKQKLFSKKVFTSPKTLLAIKDVLVKFTETDLEEGEEAVLARFIFDARESVQSEVLPEEFLENPPISDKYDNLYVLIPRDDDPDTPEHDWSRVHEWVSGKLY